MSISVSVIVPVYNGESIITMLIDSLLAQSYPRHLYEIIVVENGSTDRTIEVVSAYPEVQLLRSVERGPAAARNLGIAHSKADVIAFTDADCIAEPNWLEELVRAYSDLGVGGVAGEIIAYQHAHQTDVERFSDETSLLQNYISGSHEFLPHLYTANASYRREALIKVNGFNPKFATGEDVELSWRMQLETTYKVAYAPKAVINHRHRTSLARLKRQYYQYGFGEIFLDTEFGRYPGYPRTRQYQMYKIATQIIHLPIYLFSIVLRCIRYSLGSITKYDVLRPYYQLSIEYSVIVGKIEGMVLTRMMTTTETVVKRPITEYIKRFY